MRGYHVLSRQHGVPLLRVLRFPLLLPFLCPLCPLSALLLHRLSEGSTDVFQLSQLQCDSGDVRKVCEEGHGHLWVALNVLSDAELCLSEGLHSA